MKEQKKKESRSNVSLVVRGEVGVGDGGEWGGGLGLSQSVFIKPHGELNPFPASRTSYEVCGERKHWALRPQKLVAKHRACSLYAAGGSRMLASCVSSNCWYILRRS